MEFRIWLERRFLETPQWINTEIENFIKKLPKIRKILTGNGNEYLGYISIRHGIPIYAMHLKSDGAYNKNGDRIEINYRILNKPDAVWEILHHELTHAIDPKSKFPNSPDYQRLAATSDPRYFKLPVEFDAYGANFAKFIRRELLQLPPYFQQKVISKIKEWLRRGSPAEPPSVLRSLFNFSGEYAKSLTNYMQMHQQIWRQNPKLWKIFQQRLYNLLDNLP